MVETLGNRIVDVAATAYALPPGASVAAEICHIDTLTVNTDDEAEKWTLCPCAECVVQPDVRGVPKCPPPTSAAVEDLL